MNAASLGLSLGTGALKPECTTAQACYNAGVQRWNQFIALGGHISVLELDEPLWTVMGLPQWPLPRDQNYAVAQTAEFICCVVLGHTRSRKG
jgi:hypothetical protein